LSARHNLHAAQLVHHDPGMFNVPFRHVLNFV